MGRIEGEGPRGEPTPSQKQNSPEPGAGPLSLPPPPGPEQQPQQESELKRRIEEMRTSHENRYLEEVRTLSETDPALFATRAMGALEELLKARVPHAERRKERDGEKSQAYVKAAGYTRETLLPHGRLLQNARRNGENFGYVKGLLNR